MNKEMQTLLTAARKQGWTTWRGTKHWIVQAPSGAQHSIPSSREGRSYHNARAALRRMGLEV